MWKTKKTASTSKCLSSDARVEIRDCENHLTVVGWDDARTVVVEGAARQVGDTIMIEN